MSVVATPAEIVAGLLVLGGQAVNPPGTVWPVSTWTMPVQGDDVPDNYITIYDTGGDIDGRRQRSGEYTRHPAVQLRVRSGDGTGFGKGVALIDYLTKSVYKTVVSLYSQDIVVQNVSLVVPLRFLLQEEISQLNRRMHHVADLKLVYEEAT